MYIERKQKPTLQLAKIFLNVGLDLEKALEVVNLEDRVDSNNNDLENTPPLDAGIR